MAIFRILLFLLLPFTLQAQFIPDSIDFDLDHDSAGTRIEFRMWSGEWQFLIQDTVQFSPRFSYSKFTDDLIYDRNIKRLSKNVYALRIEHQADSVQLRYADKEITSRFGIFMDTLTVDSDRLVIDSKAYLDNLIQTNSFTFFMALPTGTNYASTTLPNPDSDLTDSIVLVDLADMPQTWWDAVDTSDPTKGRASKDDASEESATELATEWIAFNDTAETGLVWVKWSGTNSASAAETLRIYPPQAANTSYAVTDPFGRNAVWSDYLSVLHLTESGNGTTGEYVDATGNNRGGTGGDGTAGDVPTQTTTDNPWGINWQDFDGTGDYIALEGMDSGVLDGTNLTIQAIFKPDADGTDESGIVAQRNQGTPDDNGFFQLNFNDNAGLDNRNMLTTYFDGTNETEIVGTTEVDAGTGSTFWVAATFSSTLVQIILDGAVDVEDTSPTIDPTTSTFNSQTPSIGGYFDFSNARTTNCKIAEVRYRGEQLSQDWLNYERSNQGALGTFWGTWTWQAVSTMGATSNIGYDATTSGAATASMSATSDITLDMTDSGTASAIQSITNAITYGMSVSTGDINAMNVSIGDISFGFTSSMLSQATSTVSSDIVFGMSETMTSSAVLSTSSNIAYAITVAAQAATSMGVTSDYTLDITVSMSEIVATITVPDSRTITFRVQDREIVMPKQDRSIKITS